MSVNSRTAGQQTDASKAAPRLVAASRESAQGSSAAFIAIAVGVLAIAVGGAVFLSGKMNAPREPIRQIPELAAELDHEQLKAALATQAFPDPAGKAFMTKAANFPEARDALLGQMADAAKAGADRHELVRTVDAWRQDFAYANYETISRSGAMGFDKSMQLANAQIEVMSKTRGCSVMGVRHLIDNPFRTASLPDYGTPGYNVFMQSSAVLVDLAAAGASRPHVEGALRVSDGKAVLGAFGSQMKDPMATSILRTVIQTAGGDVNGKARKGRPKKRAQPTSQLKPDEVDVCALGKTLVGKLQGLPAETKERLWATSFRRSVTAHVMAGR